MVPAPAGTPPRTLTSPLPGTGPYRVDAATDGRHFVLSRNTYFREWSAAAQPAGFPDRIRWFTVADARAAADAVRRGRADLAELTPLGVSGKEGGRLVDALRVEMPTRVHRTAVQGIAFGVLNSARPPFDRLRARQAVNYAVTAPRPCGSSEARPWGPRPARSCRRPCRRTALLSLHAGPLRRQLPGPPISPRPAASCKASGTYGMKVTVTDVVGDYYPPLEAYLARVLRRIGYRRASTGSRTRGATRSTSSTPAAASRSRPAAGSRTSRCPPTSTNYSRAGQADTRRGTATRAWTGERPGRPPCSSRIRAPPSAPGPGSTGR